ncbi:RelA/SpoT domain-containing protein [Phaeobacter sp. G2]|nr:RelA/SpoT domain-containing protein [Phaeobacter sp. G2]
MDDSEWAAFQEELDNKLPDTKLFMNGVSNFFESHPSVRLEGSSVIHSMKYRMKDLNHLREKVTRKKAEGRDISPHNLFETVTDLAGVRLLLLFQEDFGVIDKSIRDRVGGQDWVLHEKPKAFTWDPEATRYFDGFDLDIIQRDTSYTSVHYLLKPRADSHVCCELQVRTLFEEIWGEIDHRINYPTPTANVACREQLMVLSKIVGAGSRLVDSIQRSLLHEDGEAPEN